MSTVILLLGFIIFFMSLLATVKRDQDNQRKAWARAREASRDRSQDWERHRGKK